MQNSVMASKSSGRSWPAVHGFARTKDMKRRKINFCMLATLLALLVACRAAEPGELQSVTLVVINGIVVDGTGAESIADGYIAIQGNHIATVGKMADFITPDNAMVMDAAGGTILPGIINSHAHRVSPVGTRRILFLLDGVTSVCDVGVHLSRMQEFEQEEIQSGPAARGFKAGPMITAPGGYPGATFGLIVSYEIQGDDAARNAVLDLHKQGADYIKVALEPGFDGENLPVITIQELRTIVETAHEKDLQVRAHVMYSPLLDMALDAGVDVIEHVPLPSYAQDELETMFDDAGVFRMPAELEAQMLRMIEQDVVLVPTLDIMVDVDKYGNLMPDVDVSSRASRSVVQFFHNQGGIIAVGNDYGVPRVDPGMPLREMDLLQQAGLSPLEVLQAATKNAAYVCGHGEELGTLAAGKLADLIVVSGNPLNDLNAMNSVLYVVKDGEVVVSPQQDNK